MNVFFDAISLLISTDNDLLMIVRLSLWVSLIAVLVATLIGMPLGAATALYKFPGRKTPRGHIKCVDGVAARCCRADRLPVVIQVGTIWGFRASV
jgi:ABC-type tungstate transport system substrate-binding protein